MEKSEFRVLIKHCFFNKRRSCRRNSGLVNVMGNLLYPRQMVERWIAKFKRGRMSTNDAEWSGWPKDVTTPEIIKNIHDIVLDDPKVKERELDEAAGISIGSVVKILHEDLRMRKLSAKWVPHLLTIDQKRRVRDSKSSLDLFNRNPSNFSRRLVTIDET